MRLLAEFIMRGRVQAMWMAMLGSWIPYLSQTSLSLVTLRKGWQEGLLITLAASLPAAVGLFFGEAGPVIVVATVCVYIVTHGTSYVLRVWASWPIALMANLLLCGVFALVMGLNERYVKADLSSLVANLRPQGATSVTESGVSSEALLAQIAALHTGQIVGAAAFFFQMASLPGVVVARWLQALLYNPGGFREEFHGLRFHPVVAVALLLAYLASLAGGEMTEFWAMTFAMPMVVAGLGFVHFALAKVGVRTAGCVAFYVAFILLRPLSTLVLVGLAAADALFDVRSKFQFKR